MHHTVRAPLAARGDKAAQMGTLFERCGWCSWGAAHGAPIFEGRRLAGWPLPGLERIGCWGRIKVNMRDPSCKIRASMAPWRRPGASDLVSAGRGRFLAAYLGLDLIKVLLDDVLHDGVHAGVAQQVDHEAL